MIGVLLVGVALVAGVVMPILTWRRLASAQAEIAALSARIRALEGAHAPTTAEAQASAPPQQPIAWPSPSMVPRTEPTPGQAVPGGAIATTAAAAPRSVAAAESAETLEARIGGRWLLYVGIVAIVIGAGYFEKLAIENGWIGETARVFQGVVAGAALIYAGRRFVAAGYSLYGQVICGGGIAVLYVSTYAGFTLYALVSRPVAFLLMTAITGCAAWLADRQRSEALALMAVGGGFLTPFLLPGRADPQLVVFPYDAILVAGTMFLARRRQWPGLNAVSYVFTAITIATWAFRFYAPSKYLRTELFLTLFCAMFLYILRETRRTETRRAHQAAALLWSAPAAYYLASVAILSTHSVALLLFLIVLAAIGTAVAVRAGSIVRLVFWMLCAAPMLPWVLEHQERTWLARGLSAVAAIYVLYLGAHLESTRRQELLAPSEIALLHLNGLWAFGCSYVLISQPYAGLTAPLAAALAGVHAALAAHIAPRGRAHALHFAALAFTLLAIAITLQLDGPWVTVAWAMEGAVMIALGLREQRDWMRIAGAFLFVIAIGRFFGLLSATSGAEQIPFMNGRAATGFVLVALSYAISWLHRRDGAVRHAAVVASAILTAQVLTLAVVTKEIVVLGRPGSATRIGVATDLMLSLTWALYATVLIVVGIRRDYAPIRYFAIGAFAITIAKVFMVDLATLDRIYRVSSIVGVGVLSLVASYLYQRFRMTSQSTDA